MIEEFEEIKLTDSLPKSSCVYLLMNGIEVCYVGNTINLKFRIVGHKKQKIKDYGEQFDSIYFIQIEDDKERNKLERKFIEEFEPKWNYQTESFSEPVPNPWTGEVVKKSCNRR